MNSIIQKIKAFRKDEKGATMVEYGLVVAIIAIGALAATQGVATKLIALFNQVAALLHA